MSGFGGCYGCDPTCYSDILPDHSTYKGSWLLPVLLIFAALFLCGGFSWILILLGIILLFGSQLFNLIF